MMRITWKPIKDGFVATVSPNPTALRGWLPVRLTRRLDESEGFAVGTWKLTGPVRTNLWTRTTSTEAKNKSLMHMTQDTSSHGFPGAR